MTERQEEILDEIQKIRKERDDKFKSWAKAVQHLAETKSPMIFSHTGHDPKYEKQIDELLKELTEINNGTH